MSTYSPQQRPEPLVMVGGETNGGEVVFPPLPHRLRTQRDVMLVYRALADIIAAVDSDTSTYEEPETDAQIINFPGHRRAEAVQPGTDVAVYKKVPFAPDPPADPRPHPPRNFPHDGPASEGMDNLLSRARANFQFIIRE